MGVGLVGSFYDYNFMVQKVEICFVEQCMI